MRLKVLLPKEVLVDRKVTKVVAEGENGFFCLLPRHVDFLSALVPGLLSFVSMGGAEEFLAVDEGILIKCGPEVLVSTRNAVRGPNLGTLKQTIETSFRHQDEQEELTRSAFAKLEANFIRRLMDLEKYG
ncbi:MAG: F0F1 ATP synthase subunit epsilon [Thermodesulfobacteriota bacterium]|nr:F0F1 ATP synthase subunit epsilon [Thermodesulfobacteriota bacterium]